MSGKLVAKQGPQEGLELTLEDNTEWIIGRDPDECQLLIEDPKVSRKHILCRQVSEGVILENLSSTNPVRINENLVKGPVLLQEGDKIRIGEGSFLYTAMQENATNQENDTHLIAIAEEDENVVEELEEELSVEDEIPKKEDDHVKANSESTEEATTKPPQALTEEDFMSYYDTIYEEREVVFGTPIPAPPEEKATEKDEGDREKSPEEEEEEEEEATEEPSKEEDSAIKTRWILKVLSGSQLGEEFPLKEGEEYTIGSDVEACDITFTDVSVSKEHARLSLSEEGEFNIEDLESKNGVTVAGELIEGSVTLHLEQSVELGTMQFHVIDTEAKRDAATASTAVTEGAEGVKSEEETREPSLQATALELLKTARALPQKLGITTGQLALMSIIISFILIIGVGTVSLFQSENIELLKVDHSNAIREITNEYPDVEYRFNNGELFVLGHISTKIRRDQLIHSLQTLSFVSKIESHIIIDELVWQETNKILSKNQNWKGISMHSPHPGSFVLTGYLKTRFEGESLTNYITLNFPYLELLENLVVVEENVMEEVSVTLMEAGFHDIFVELTNGELTLSGYLSSNRKEELVNMLHRFKDLPGIRTVKNFTVELAPEDSMINLSQRYRVTGHFKHGDVSRSVIINGKILARGDSLDGMTITNIKSNAIFLEKDGFKFKIDYK